jgi:GT2 family glycosyltransferase
MVQRDTLARAAAVLSAHPEVDALIGSYDDTPAAPNFVSQYKNLLHHYIHQTGRRDATTFWTGCGAVKRSVFVQLGGFDAGRYPRPSIEDIELGYRLLASGGSIRLEKEVQVTHLKRWTLRSLLLSDIRDRALPWSQLLLDTAQGSADLNLQWRYRLSALLIVTLPALFVLRRWRALLLLAPGLLLLNAGFYRFLLARRGLWFTLRAVGLHWLYYGYSTAALAWVVGRNRARFSVV